MNASQGEQQQGQQAGSQQGRITHRDERTQATQPEGQRRPTGQNPYLVTVPKSAANRINRPCLLRFCTVRPSRAPLIRGGLSPSVLNPAANRLSSVMVGSFVDSGVRFAAGFRAFAADFCAGRGIERFVDPTRLVADGRQHIVMKVLDHTRGHEHEFPGAVSTGSGPCGSLPLGDSVACASRVGDPSVRRGVLCNCRRQAD